MDKDAVVAALKARLLRDVAYICRRADRLWNEPIVQLRDLRGNKCKSVFFGGTLRSLIISRLLKGALGRPRDLDIVVAKTTLETLRKKFRELISRETRFGGLQLLREHWHFDIWPLDRTYAFIEDETKEPKFEDLPATTFFNLEAIAVEVWPAPGTPRIVYVGEREQFFEGILTRTLEINREGNPFPTLCVVRALVLAGGVDLAIGPKLARYLAHYAGQTSDEALIEVQKKHYGRLRLAVSTMRNWLDHVQRKVDSEPPTSIKLPILRQRTFWPDENESWPMLSQLKRSLDPTKNSGARHMKGETGS